MAKTEGGQMNLDAHQFLTAISTAVVKTPPPTPYGSPASGTVNSGQASAVVLDSRLGSLLGWVNQSSQSRSFVSGRQTRKKIKAGKKSAINTRPKHKRQSKFKPEFVALF